MDKMLVLLLSQTAKINDHLEEMQMITNDPNIMLIIDECFHENAEKRAAIFKALGKKS